MFGSSNKGDAKWEPCKKCRSYYEELAGTLEQTKSSSESNISKLNRDVKAARDKGAADLAALEARLKKEYDGKMAAVKAEAQKQREALEAQIEKMKKDAAAQLEDGAARGSVEIEELTARFQAEIEGLKTQHEQEQADAKLAAAHDRSVLEEEHATDLREWRKKRDELLVSLRKKDEAVAEIKKQLEDKTSELDKTQQQLAMTESNRDLAEKQLSLQKRITTENHLQAKEEIQKVEYAHRKALSLDSSDALAYRRETNANDFLEIKLRMIRNEKSALRTRTRNENPKPLYSSASTATLSSTTLSTSMSAPGLAQQLATSPDPELFEASISSPSAVTRKKLLQKLLQNARI
ncbi:unnamed protein product [Amoebophrya sp. A120]|nr:unnamed protein product [Amoebophrya sp. A120]|eukprot:GSA120T00020107001.1